MDEMDLINVTTFEVFNRSCNIIDFERVASLSIFFMMTFTAMQNF